jgi:nicotinate-nucleotide adenylyltransferase
VKIGVLGGTFDPIHLGHLAAAEAAIECADLDEVIFVPTGNPPHRPRAVATDPQRLEMARLATADEPRFAVSDVELSRDGPSYTLDTLLALRGANPHAELFLVLGWDAAALFHAWHRPKEVLAVAPIIVVSRPGRAAPGEEDVERAGIDHKRAILCMKSTPAISASEIRRAVAAGESVAGKVPEAVARYIASHRIYRDNR